MGLFPDSAVDLPVWAWVALVVLVFCMALYRWFSPYIGLQEKRRKKQR